MVAVYLFRLAPKRQGAGRRNQGLMTAGSGCGDRHKTQMPGQQGAAEERAGSWRQDLFGEFSWGWPYRPQALQPCR